MNQRNPVNLSDLSQYKAFAIGTRRVWWHDESHDWQVRVSVDLGNGRLSIVSGPCWDYEGEPDGCWGEESSQGTVTHCVTGYDKLGMVAFAQYVQDQFVGDPFIVPAVKHLIASQDKSE